MAGFATRHIIAGPGRRSIGAMCTLVLLLRPGHDWPLLIAANRDERLDRPADLPAAWWTDQPDVIGGRDRAGGGTWLALRTDGLVAAVLNRTDSLGPAPGFASRGTLPLRALAAGGIDFAINEADYRPYNLILAGRAGAWFRRGGAGVEPALIALAPGLHMVTARDPDDGESRRIDRHLPRLRAAPAPAPPDWSEWQAILSDRSGSPESQINIAPISGFGTVSASRIALPATGAAVFQHAAGAPDQTAFRPVGMGLDPSVRK
jgi:hypothetical protein